MNQATVKSIRINSHYQFDDCYIVVGTYTSKAKSLLPYEDFFEQIQGSILNVSNKNLEIELWRYQPQQLIKKWSIYRDMEKMSEEIYIFADELWQVLLKIRTIPIKLNPKPKQIAKSDSLKQISTRSNSPSKSKKKGAMDSIKKALRQKINLLIVKPQPKTHGKEGYQNYYSASSSKYPSFFTNNSNSQTQINQTYQEFCAQKNQKEYYNKEAQNIYGFDGPKQVKLKQTPKPRLQKRLFQSFY